MEKKKGNLDINGCHLLVGGARVCELERYMHLVGRTEREREREGDSMLTHLEMQVSSSFKKQKSEHFYVLSLI